MLALACLNLAELSAGGPCGFAPCKEEEKRLRVRSPYHLEKPLWLKDRLGTVAVGSAPTLPAPVAHRGRGTSASVPRHWRRVTSATSDAVPGVTILPMGLLAQPEREGLRAVHQRASSHEERE